MNARARLACTILFVLMFLIGVVQHASAGAADWMGDNYTFLRDRTLRQIIIPGSHDAGMSTTRDCKIGAADCNTKTQNKSIKDQLLAGSRYFDLRPVTYAGGLYLGHYSSPEQYRIGCNGENLTRVLNDVNDFVNAHPGEIVILSFDEYYDRDYTFSLEEQLVQEVRSILGNKLVKLAPDETLTPRRGMRTLTFKQILEKGKVITVFDALGGFYDKQNGILQSDDLAIYNEYSNKNTMSAMKDDAEKGQFPKLANSANHKDKMFVLSWTLTQQGSQIYCAGGILEFIDDIAGLFAADVADTRSILDMAAVANSELWTEVNNRIVNNSHYLYPNWPNILYVDDFGTFATDVAVHLDQIYCTNPVNAAPQLITAETVGNGSISSQGTTTLLFGESRTYTFTPDPGHHLAFVQVDGRTVGLVSSYTFTYSCDGDHTITAVFAQGAAPEASLDQTFPQTAWGGFVSAEALQADGGMIVGGKLSGLKGTADPHLARLIASGPSATVDTSFSPVVSGSVHATVVQADGKILLAGLLSAITGTTRNNIARINQDGSVDPDFNPDINGEVLAMAIQPDGKIVVGGNFTSINGQPKSYLARLNTDGTLDNSCTASPNGVVRTIAIRPDGRIIFGGDFTHVVESIGTYPWRYIAGLHADGSFDYHFTGPYLGGRNAGTEVHVRAIAIQPDGQILVGGEFTTLYLSGYGDKTDWPFLLRFRSGYGLDVAFKPALDGPVNSISLQADGKITIGGEFKTVDGQVRYHVARINQDGSLDEQFVPYTDGAVYSTFILPDGSTLLGGNFTFVPGHFRNGISRFTGTGQSETISVDSNGTRISLMRSGPLPDFPGVNFYGSTTNSPNPDDWVLLGAGTRIEGGWELKGVSLPSDYYLKARARTYGGLHNASSSLIETEPRRIHTLNASAGAHGSIDKPGSTKVHKGDTFAYSITSEYGYHIKDILVDGSSMMGSLGDSVYTALSGTVSVPTAATYTFSNIASSRTMTVSFEINTYALTASLLSSGGSPTNGSISPSLVWMDHGPQTQTYTITPDPGYHIADLRDNNVSLGTLSSYTVTATSKHDITVRFKQNPTAAIIDPGFDQIETMGFVYEGVVYSYGTVRAMALQPDGKIVIGGDFLKLGNQSRNYVARLLPDGSLDAQFDPSANDSIFAATIQPDGRIIVAGEFTAVASQGRNRIARLNQDGSLDAAFNPDANGGVFAAVIQPDGKILIGGGFTMISGQARNRLARLNPDGTPDTAFIPDLNDKVRAIAVQPDGKILVGGDFTAAGGQARNRIARLNPDGTLDTAFTPGASGMVRTISVQLDGRILIAGDFYYLNGAGRNRIGRLNPDGTVDGFNPGLNGPAYCSAIQPDGKILVGGSFTGRIKRLNPDGTVDSTYVSYNSDGRAAYSIAVQPDGKILAGCSTVVNRHNTDGTFDLPDTAIASSNGHMYASAVLPDGKVLFGGKFTLIGGQYYYRDRLARMRLDGTPDTLRPVLNGPVRSLAVQPDGKIVAGGEFTYVDSWNRKRLARINTDGTLDTTFTANLNAAAHSVAVQPDGKILAGGEFTSVNGAARNHFARINQDGSVDVINPDVNGAVHAVTVQSDGKILLGGDFTAVGGATRTRLARINADGSLDSFAPVIDGAVRAIAIQSDGKILLGGDFSSVAGATRNHLARLAQDGTLDDFNPDIDNSVYAIAIRTDGKIMIGGAFIFVGDQLRYRLARLHSDGTLDAAFDTDADNTVYSVAIAPDGRIIAAGKFTYAGGQSLKYAARLVSGDTASQSLSAVADGSAIRWMSGGAGSKVDDVEFYGSSNAADWTSLASGTMVANGWQLNNLSLPTDTNYYIKAKGMNSAGAALQESVRNVFLKPFTLTSSVTGTNGALEPGTTVVNRGETQTFTISPNEGYGSEVWVDGVPVGLVSSYTFSHVLTNHTITASFGVLENGVCGTDNGRTGLAAPPVDLCASGQASAFTGAWSWTCNGRYGGTSANCSAEIQKYEISASVVISGETGTTGGAVSPSGTVPVNLGSAPTFTFTPAGGYHLTEVKVDGSPVALAGSYTFNSVTAPHTIEARFAINTYTLTSSVSGTGGAIHPAVPNPLEVSFGETRDFGIVPDIGYQAADVQVDGVSVGAVTRYTFSDVRANHTIAASFASKSAGALLDRGFYPDVDNNRSIVYTADFITAVALQPDGKILLSGKEFSARIRPDGNMDETFTGGFQNNRAFVVQPDGKVLTFGDMTPLVRIAQDGAPDMEFVPNAAEYRIFGIKALALQRDGKIVIGGHNMIVGGEMRNLARLNSDGTRDETFTSSIDSPGSVSAIAIQPDGKIIVGGIFTSVSGTTRNNLARLNQDGTIDAGFNPAFENNAFIYSITLQPDGSVLVGLAVQGYLETKAKLIRLRPTWPENVETWIQDGAFNPVAIDLPVPPQYTSVSINAVAIQTDGKIIVAGHFTQVNGQARNNIARLLMNGSLDTAFDPNADAKIEGIVIQPDGKILAGGDFENISGQPRKYLARLYPDGNMEAAFNPGANQAVSVTALQADRKVIVAGDFTTIAGQPRNRLARILENGSVDSGFNPSPTGSVFSIANLTDGKMIVAGDFNSIGGGPANRIARLNPDGSQDATFTMMSIPDALVRAVAVRSGGILVAGDFTNFATLFPPPDNIVMRPHIARFFDDGSLDMNFNPQLDSSQTGTIGSIAVQRVGATEYIVLGGTNFYTSPTNSLGGLIRFDDEMGHVDQQFLPEVRGGDVRSVAVQPDGMIVIGGNFTSVGNQTRHRIARLNPFGELDEDFDPNADEAVNSIALQADGSIIIGGEFTTIDGQPRNHIARLNPDGSVDATYDPGADGEVRTLAIQHDGKVIVGGSFGSVDGMVRNNIARLLPTGPAYQRLSATSSFNGSSRITWMRSGSSPEIGDASFSYSFDGSTWESLGPGFRMPAFMGADWELVGITSLPASPGTSFYLKAQGKATGSGTASVVESMQWTSIVPYHLTVVSEGSGTTIPQAGSVVVDSGASQAVMFTPDAGYHVAEVVVDGQVVEPNMHYLFDRISEDHSISVRFAPDCGTDNGLTLTAAPVNLCAAGTASGVSGSGHPWSWTCSDPNGGATSSCLASLQTWLISSATGTGGSLSPSGAVTVDHGTGKTFAITPDDGYFVDNVWIDGSPVGSITTYTFDPVAAEHSIQAVFALSTYNLVPSAGSGGSISPDATVVLNKGGNHDFAIAPAPNYHLVDVLVDGASVGLVTGYTFTNVAADHTISAAFAIDTYTVSASAGPNGGISPGTVTLDHGGSRTFTITPSPNFHIADVLVDGVSAGPVSEYTFSNVTANHAISATFAIDTRTITASAGADGGINPSGAVEVNHDGSQTFTITPLLNHHIADVLVDGVSAGVVSSYTFSTVTEDHTISAAFAIDTRTITASAGANGGISPSGAVAVSHEGSQTFTITPSANYQITDVLVDGVSAGVVSSYTFSTVSADHTISAAFTLDTHTLTYTAGLNGSISGTGIQTVDHGGSGSEVVAVPDPGYHFLGWSDGLLVSARTDTNVNTGISVTANFGLNTLRVKNAGLTSGSCDTWTNACDLQYALGIAQTGAAIWVQAGIYTATTGTERHASFRLNPGVALFGGFGGAETGLAQRNFVANVTTLSGDIGVPGDNSDNSYHVVIAIGAAASILDGFTIADGNADGTYFVAARGGGIYIHEGAPTLSNVTFRGNAATADGGAIYNYRGNAWISDAIFSGNTATAGGALYNYDSSSSISSVTFSENTAVDGGGLYADGGSPGLSNVTFSGNAASRFGGAIYTGGTGSLTLTNTTFTGNTAPVGSAGAIYSSGTMTMMNSIVWANSSPQVLLSAGTGTIIFTVLEGGCPASGACSGILDSDPLLGGLGAFGGYAPTIPLLAGSPAINAGDDGACAAVDQRGIVRPQGAHCDRGAFEAAETDSSTSLISSGTAAYGEAVTFTATVSPLVVSSPTLTGTVTFSEGNALCSSVTLVGGTAACSTSLLTAGTHTITATYDAGGYYTTSSATVQQVVIKAASSTLISAATNTPGVAVFTATVTTGATGTLTFSDGTADYPVELASGSALLTLPTASIAADAVALSAVYGGDGNFLSSSSSLAQCEPGMFSTTGFSPCTPCPAGTYQPGAGGIACIPSPAGYYVGSIGQAAAIPCPVGTYTDALGAASCSICPTGYTTTATGETTCTIMSFAVTPASIVNGGINPNSVQTVNYNQTIAFTLTPDAGYHIGLVSGCSGTLSGSTYTTGSIVSNCTVTASFAINAYTLSYAAGPSGSISGAVTQTVNHGASGSQVAAVPDAGYHFAGWSDGSAVNPRTDTNVTGNLTVSANFTNTAPTVPTSSSPAPAGETGTATPALIVNASTDPDGDPVSYLFEIDTVNSFDSANKQFSGWTSSSSWTPAALADNTAWYWRVQATDGTASSGWMSTTSFFVNTANDAPTTPGISSPADNSQVASLTPVLAVTNANDVDNDVLTYEFEVYLNSNYTGLAASTTGIAQGGSGSTSWTVSPALTDNTTYYWRARSRDEHNLTGSYVAGAFFVNTTNDAPTAPTISSPAAGSETTDTAPSLSVTNATDADGDSKSYIFEIDTVNTFNSGNKQISGVIAEGAGTTSWTPAALADNTTWYWRVKASDGVSDGPWMTTASLFVNTTNDAPGVPSLLNPADGSDVTVLNPTLSLNPASDPDNDALTYEFAVYSDSGLTSLVTSTTAAGTSWVVSPSLDDNTGYWWTARAVDEHGAASNWMAANSFSVNNNGTNDAPTITLLSPAAADLATAATYTIAWTDSDPDSNAVITLGYDTTGSGCNGTEIAANISEDDSTNTFAWDLVSAPSGTYHVYALISDGTTTTCSYAPGGTVDTSSAQCQSGSFSTTGLLPCTLCPPGSYQDQSRQTSCIPASPGFFVDSSGQTAAVQCPIGAYSNTTGASTCSVCPVGYTTASAGATSCAPIIYPVTPTAGTGGTISPDTVQSVSYSQTTAFTVAPGTGYHISLVSGCSGTLSGNTYTTGAIVSSCTVTADFAMNTYTLTYAAGSNGTINGTASQTVNYNANGTTVSAVANTGYHFVNWSDGSTANPRTDANVTGNVSVTASFAINTYTLSYSAGSNGTLTGTASQTVNSGASGTQVTAVPATGYHFVSWSDGSTVNPRSDMNVTGNITVTANYAINTYTLSYAAGSNGSLTGMVSQTVNYGASGTQVTAVPATGYHFVNWSDGSIMNPRIDSNVTGGMTITANFDHDAMNGACGTSDGVTMTSAPATNLCSAGIASAIAGSGPWTWTCSGQYGGTNVSCSANLQADTTGPSLTLSTLADGSVTNNASLNITGSVTDNLGLQSLVISGATVTVNNDNTFSYLVTLSTGSNTISTVATDLAGNTTTDTRVIILDQNGPAFAILLPADNSVTNQLVSTVAGTVDETSTVSVRLNDGTAQFATMTGNTFSASVNLASGMNTIDVTATDLAGNTSSGKRTVTYDPVSPSVAITIPAQDIVISQPIITISGTVSDALTEAAATITVDGTTSALTLVSGAFSTSITLANEGRQVITITAVDTAGNSSSVQRNINYVKFGDLDDDGDVDTVDALKALRIAAGIDTATAGEQSRGDAAPIVNGTPAPDGSINIGDVVVILRRAVGLVSW